MRISLVSCFAFSAAAASDVIVGDVRVQALSPNLLRVEPKGPKGFEDRTTFMVANRDFQGLSITQATTEKGTLLSTDHYQVLLRSGGGTGSGSCSDYQSGFDVTDAVRSPTYPDGASGVSSASSCCEVCSEDATCTAWVFVDSFKGCYPLASYGGTTPSSDHSFGGPGKRCGAQQGAVDVVGPVRSASFLDGTSTGSAGECCDKCKSDSTCVAYVFVESFGGCYPLSGYTGTTSGDGRTFGTVVQAGGASFQVSSLSGEVFFDTAKDSRSSRLHWPAALTAKAYGIVDQPRFFVPEWACAPVPADVHVDPSLADSNGYDYSNQATGDTYVFMLGSELSTYNAARKDFVELTGPTPVLPDYAYGTWFTFWNQYTEDSAKADILQWEALNLPLDVWGLDINWRGVSYPDHMHEPNQCDYDHPDTKAFPDFDGWFQWLREHNLRTYHNDHPCGQAPQTNPVEVEYRYNGLGKWLGKGMTFWWYDQNWYLGIPPPFKSEPGEDWDGLTTPAWGSHVFWTATSHYDENVLNPKGDTWYGKPMALSKSFKPDWKAGMDPIEGAEHPSHHRYPVHWTGDSVTLQASVESMVDAGLHSFKPYVHSDCGGDYGQTDPNPDDVTSAGGLLRWTGHCAYGSILRFHGADHRVWQYDEVTQSAFRNYLTARHQLIPTILSAAQRTTETGHPLVARLDLEWPEHEESRSNSQYLFLDDILVAPIFDSTVSSRSVFIPPGQWQDAWDPSVVVTGPKTVTASQPVSRIPMWHRRDGGLLFVAHGMNSTRVETQDWSSLSIEAFPSSGAVSNWRLLHERDGSGATKVELRTDGQGGVHLHVGAAPRKRAWVVRLHLRPGERLGVASVDDAELGGLPMLHLEPNAEKDEYFPSFGAGSMPPHGSGRVAEIHLAAGSHARRVQVQVVQEGVVV